MPRRHYKRPIIKPDAVYNSVELAKLINYIMMDGKKSVAQKMVYNAMELLKKDDHEPIDVLLTAINNVGPTKEVKARRVGGASYQVPIDTRQERRLYLALTWIVNAARSRPNKQYHTFSEKLHAELLDAYQNQGEAVNKRLQIEKVAQANRAFAHFGW